MSDDVITVTAVPSRRVKVGVNYPWAWNKFGVYFGNGETAPMQNPEYDAWTDNLYRNLGILKSIGVSVVRIFLFGNANNLGQIHDVGGSPLWPSDYWWAFTPPSGLHPIYLSQLRRMLDAFAAHDMQVIPSLLSFEAVEMWRSGSGCGRTDLIVDSASRRWFLEQVVDPFMRIAKDAKQASGKDVIFAWEVMNEPGQVVEGLVNSVRGLFVERTEFPIPLDDMNSFLDDVIARIRAAGFESTVGNLWQGDLTTLRTGSIPQFHYYPQNPPFVPNGQFTPFNLPAAAEVKNAIIGEFAATLSNAESKYGIPWPELRPTVQAGTGYVRMLARLRLIEQKGYSLALVWPDVTSECDFQPNDPSHEPVHLTQPVQDAIKRYVDGG